MRIKYIVAGVAVALAVSVGSAFAAEQFATLDGVTVQPMSAVQMQQIRGAGITVFILGAINPDPFGGIGAAPAFQLFVTDKTAAAGTFQAPSFPVP